MADRLRAAGLRLAVDTATVEARRRVKTATELAGIMRAQRAAEAGIAAEVVERAGHPTQRTRAPGETLTHGFAFRLGHGARR